MLNAPLSEVDPELVDIIEKEKNRQYKVRAVDKTNASCVLPTTAQRRRIPQAEARVEHTPAVACGQCSSSSGSRFMSQLQHTGSIGRAWRSYSEHMARASAMLLGKGRESLGGKAGQGDW